MSSAFDEAVVRNPAHFGQSSSVTKGSMSISQLSKQLMWVDKEVSALQTKLNVAKKSGKYSHLMDVEDSINKACMELKSELELSLSKPENESNTGDRHKLMKIHRDFVNVMKKFNNISSELSDASLISANELRESFQRNSLHDHDEEKGLQFAQIDRAQDLDEYLVEERLREAEIIAKKTIEINALFTDVSNLVKKQGEDIQIITDNVDTSLSRTEAGVGHLVAAQRHQQSTGKCLKCLLAFVLLVICISLTAMNTTVQCLSNNLTNTF